MIDRFFDFTGQIVIKPYIVIALNRFVLQIFEVTLSTLENSLTYKNLKTTYDRGVSFQIEGHHQ